MSPKLDFKKLRTSWTKYDIVQVMDAVFSLETLEKFKRKEISVNDSILKSFLGIKSLNDPIPDYWITIQNYPEQKKLFAFFAILFTHIEVITDFADKYCKGNMKGSFKVEGGKDAKRNTNIRSALVESGAAEPSYRKTKIVPFDFTVIFQKPEVGKLFKSLLMERISRFIKTEINDADFYEICYENNFHKAISLNEEQFKAWLEGVTRSGSYIKQVQIQNFFCVENVELDFGKFKEIYFLGENGDGKSLILMALYLAFNGNYILTKTNQEQTGKVVDIIKKNKAIELTGYDNVNNNYKNNTEIQLNNFFAYGTHRGRYSTDTPEEYGFMSLFDSEQTLKSPVAWLKDQKLLELNSELADGDVRNLINSFPVKLLEKMYFELLERNVEIRVEGTEVFFREKGSDLMFDQLSEGYKSILIFISDLLYRFNKTAKTGQMPIDFQGVVLVDEIDLHLHPKWQRSIVSKLRKLFPRVQFFFTTHSPAVIQGASEEALIYRVYRNTEDGKTRVSDPYFRKHLNHMMINALVTSPLFGLEDARMNPDDDDSDTSSSYLIYKLNQKLIKEIEKQKAHGKEFLGEKEIDNIINQLIDNQLKLDDKN